MWPGMTAVWLALQQAMEDLLAEEFELDDGFSVIYLDDGATPLLIDGAA